MSAYIALPRYNGVLLHQPYFNIPLDSPMSEVWRSENEMDDHPVGRHQYLWEGGLKIGFFPLSDDRTE